MKYKQLLASLIASIPMFGTVSSVTAYAIAHMSNKTDIDSVFKDAYMIPPDDEFISNKDKCYQNQRIYLAETGYDNVYDFYSITSQKADSIDARVSGYIDREIFDKALAEICPDAEHIRLTSFQPSDTYWAFSIAGFEGNLPYDEARKKDLTYEQVRRIKNLLDNVGEVEEFSYTIKPVFFCTTRCSITHYENEQNGVSNKDLILNYITKNNLSCHIEEECFDDEFDVVPDEKISIAEHYKLAEKIYKDLNIHPYIIYPEAVDISGDITIDLLHNIDGDANDDGKLSLADAVAIIQAVRTYDECTLTPQGNFNADITGDYDGITSADAIAVMRKVLGLE